MPMTRNQEIKRLLSRVPNESAPYVVDFLRALANTRRAKSKKASRYGKRTNVAQRTFGLIPVDSTTVRQALSEDLYGFE